MADSEKTERKRGRSPEEVKADFKRFVKQWHSDKGASQVERGRSEDIPVLQVITALSKSKNLAGWPENFTTGMRIVFPDLAPEIPGRALFLPKTPEEFFDLLDYIDRRKAFPEKDFPLMNITRQQAENPDDEEGEEEPKEDPALQKFRTYILNRESISDLLYSLELLDLFNEEQLREIQFTKIFDERAYFLFVRDAWDATTMEELQPLLEEIETKKDFKFYSEQMRAQTLSTMYIRAREIESGSVAAKTRRTDYILPVDIHRQQQQLHKMIDPAARKHFIEKVRSAATIKDVENLEKNIGTFPFLNRGELGIVRSALNRKKKQISQK